MKFSSLISAGLLSLAMAVPAVASPQLETLAAQPEIQGVIHLGTLDMATGQLVKSTKAQGDTVWDNTVSANQFRNQVGEPTIEVLDEGDLPDGTVVGAIQIGFVTDSSEPVTLRYAFYQNDNFDTVGDVLSTLDGDPAIYDITLGGLIGGGNFIYTADIMLDSDFVITGPDLDGDLATDWGWGFSVVDPGNAAAGIGPLLSGPGPDPVGAPGAEDIFDLFDPPAFDDDAEYQGTFFFGGAPFAQFHMRLIEGFQPVTNVPVNADWSLLLLMAALLGSGLFFLVRR